ncbi:MAG: flagellar type III secretion system pore protein FliP [Buchnera aphidicola (Tetraneura sorini)]
MIYQIVPLLFLTLIPPTTYAKNIPGLITQNLSNGEQIWSFPIETLFFITSLTFIPAVLLMMTSFTRIIIVLGFLRSAIGTPYAPSNQILLGLSLFLTFFIMSPVFEKSYKESYIPYSENKISAVTAIQNGFQPFKKFMLKQVRRSDLELFCKLSHTSSNFPNKELIPTKILFPSFITSELKTAFQIGFTIFIPFLIIDLVVSSILMSLGMMMVPPSSISLPFKIMLFVLVDGWDLLISSLSNSFF